MVRILVAVGLLLRFAITPAISLPLARVTSDALPTDVTLPTMFRTIKILGEWNLPKGGSIKIIVFRGDWKPGCRFQNADPERCNQSRFYVSAVHEREMDGPTDFTLLKGLNGEDWQLPRHGTLKIVSTDKFSLRLCGYESQPKGGSDSLYGIGTVADYVLRIERHDIGGKHFTFSADLRKSNERANFRGGNGCETVNSVIPEFTP
jgi:hypothetical protein